MLIINKIIKLVFIPPFGLLWVCLFGLVLTLKHKKSGFLLFSFGLMTILLLSTPYANSFLRSKLETYQALTEFNHEAQAIVILGCGIIENAPEYKGPVLTSCTLERVHYGAALFEKTGLPVLVSGGKVDKTFPEAKIMKNKLENKLLSPVKWTEEESRTTRENAKFSHQILSEENINKIYLVTHSWHMKRAKRSFEKSGFVVIPAPTLLYKKEKISIKSFVPNFNSFINAQRALQEWVGILYYSLLK